MKKSIIRTLSFFLALVLLTGAVSAAANTPIEDVKEISAEIILYRTGDKDVANWIEFDLQDEAGEISEWYIFALCKRGDYPFSLYKEKLESYLTENEIYAATTKQKYALIMAYLGDKTLAEELAKDTLGKQGIMSYIFGLHLINNGILQSPTAEEAVATILQMQQEDGGWALGMGNSQIDVTAMAIQALAPYYSQPDVKGKIDNALEFLSQSQQENGDFSAYGVANPESTAQVLLALSLLEIDGLADERFIKNGNTLLDVLKKYRLEDGSFCHEEGGTGNENATAQVFMALTGYECFKAGVGNLYLANRSNLGYDKENSQNISSDSQGDNQETEEISHINGTSTHADEEKGENNRDFGYKLPISLGILATAVIICLVMLLRGKRNYKNFIFIFALCAIIISVVIFTDIKSADDYYNESAISKSAPVGTVTLEITCKEIASLSPENGIPENGIILPETTFEIEEGESVYNLLVQAARQYTIKINSTGGEKSPYIVGINNINEQLYGDLSGWVFKINGEIPSRGCGEIILKDGDEIIWEYTLSLPFN